jgi:integrase
MPLADLKVRAAKPSPKPYKLSDAGSLHLLITPNGSKLWRLSYRFGNKQRLLALGKYPDTSLSEARDKRDASKKLLADGVDPSEQRRIDKVTAKVSRANTFASVADELVSKKITEGKAASTVGKARWLLDKASADFGQRAIAEVSASEILETLRRVEASGTIDTAHRLRAVIGEVFRFAIATNCATTDPTTALRGALVAPKVTHRPAITDPVAFGALLRAIDSYDGQPETRAALQLLALLFPRPGELRQSIWEEFDLAAGIWVIPAIRTKMRREHRVPLPTQAVAILKDLKAVTGHGKAGLLFPGVRVLSRPVSDGTLNAALRRMGYSADEMTSHGFRASASHARIAPRPTADAVTASGPDAAPPSQSPPQGLVGLSHRAVPSFARPRTPRHAPTSSRHQTRKSRPVPQTRRPRLRPVHGLFRCLPPLRVFQVFRCFVIDIVDVFLLALGVSAVFRGVSWRVSDPRRASDTRRSSVAGSFVASFEQCCGDDKNAHLAFGRAL